MFAEPPTPILCKDKDDNEYTVYERGSIIPDADSENEHLKPTWFIVRDGEEVPVTLGKDAETGRKYFIFPNSDDDWKVFPPSHW